MSEYVVELKHITKRFPGVVALKDMSIGIRPGEIHGLIGENGAGKSTLIKVLTGVHTPEEGEIFVDGQKVVFKNPVQSREAGIACVYQELNIVKQLPVTDNVFMGRAVKKGLLLDYPRMHAEAEEALKTLGHPEINVHLECGKLGVGQQQMVEIAKAVSLDAKLIIMDEPTSSLGKEEIEQLMETVRGLKAKGVAILFVSHKLEELFELCDRVTVMRDGEHIITEDTVNLTEDSLINAMVGRTLDNLYPKEFGTKGEVWLEAKGLNEAGVLHDVSFKAHAGQITGFAGLVGAGRTETMRAVFGADKHIITEDTVNLTEDSLINAMVGRTLDNLYPKEFGTKGEVWLEAKGLNEAGVLHDVSFKAHAGQITGFAGLVGAGRTETMRAVFGADKLDSGEIYVKGEKVHIRTPKDAIKRKIAFLTEDRKGQGLVLNLDVRTNLVLANMKGFSNGPFLDKDRIEQAGNDNVSALKIKTPSLNEVVGQLSGGNQQKVVIGKWVNTDADIFIFDEPTRGIDVGAKIEVYRVMNDLVKAGKCVIMVSSELPEILAMSDHVVVMRGGRVMADIDRDTPHFNSEDIMKAAWGGELD